MCLPCHPIFLLSFTEIISLACIEVIVSFWCALNNEVSLIIATYFVGSSDYALVCHFLHNMTDTFVFMHHHQDVAVNAKLLL